MFAPSEQEKSIDVSPHGEHSQAQTHGSTFSSGQLDAEETTRFFYFCNKENWKKVSTWSEEGVRYLLYGHEKAAGCRLL
jgi:hypothetical protein